ncbi:hypothetical protein [uncultured Fluviicola sp.]|uniref:hypothetical protein n=1 Tax=uncultured Fluviicola sp. TaxID=463303 RepID=UPI0025F5B20F|nr:hypothetical protein [uncultured Fluviicola sp.]
MLKSTLLSITCCLFTCPQLFAQCTTGGSDAVAPYASNSSSKGVMFDVTVANIITISCFDVNLPALSVGGYEIYFKLGSYVGSETNPADWTLIGSEGSLLSLGLNLATPLSIPVNKTILAGQTFAFYITASNPVLSTGLLTTTNSGYTAITSNSDVTVFGGVGISYPFGTVTANRSFNGTIHYTPGDPLPVTLLDFTAVKINESVLLEWQTESEYNSDYFEVERSVNGIDWNRLFTINAAGESSESLIYQEMDENPIDGISYYRLNQYDLNGTKTFLKMISFNNKMEIGKNDIRVFPNPVNDRFRVFGDKSELEGLQVFNSIGEDISGNLTINALDGFTEVVFKNEIEGVLILKSKTNSQILIKK